MKKRNSAGYFIFLLIPLFLIILACEIKVPLKKMSLARLTISRAIEVKAEKYAPEELKKAGEYLFKCHESIKADKLDNAEDDAQKALDFANQAVEKSLPLLSKDTLDEAKKIFEEADMLNAEKYASEDYGAASAGMTEAEKLHNEKEYWGSYQKSLEVIKISSDAKTKSAGHVEEVKSEIAAVKGEADTLKSNKGDVYASNDIDAVNSRLDEASVSAEKSNLKDAAKKIEEAKDQLKAAQGKVALGKIDEAEKKLEETKQRKTKDEFQVEIENASSLISESKQLHGGNSFTASIEKADEAMKVLLSLDEKYEGMKKIAAEKLESARNSLEQIKQSELGKYFEEDIAKVGPVIQESSELNNNESYKESIDKSDEALGMINSINIAMEKKAEELRLSKEKQATGEEYIVKYNPKKRDCLWRIAHTVYKDAKLWPIIYMANKGIIKDPDLIFPGQKFIIPPVNEKGERVLKDKDVKDKEEKKDDTGQ